MDVMDNFWEKYYNSKDIVGTPNLQRNVGRTKNGEPISEKVWNKSIEYIKSQIELKQTDDILEICCGNGMILGELSKLCKSACGIDYSKELLTQLVEKYPNVRCFHSNVLEYKLDDNSYDKLILYFAAQHFDEKDLLNLIKTMITTTKSEGKILIGDVPDEYKKWDYILKPEHRYDYFNRLENGTPMIGNWYSKEWFSALEYYIPNIRVEVQSQPDFMINSDWRFDVVITKL